MEELWKSCYGYEERLVDGKLQCLGGCLGSLEISLRVCEHRVSSE